MKIWWSTMKIWRSLLKIWGSQMKGGVRKHSNDDDFLTFKHLCLKTNLKQRKIYINVSSMIQFFFVNAQSTNLKLLQGNHKIPG